MKLLTQDILKKLNPLRSTESIGLDKVKAIVKFFLPSGIASWYAWEFDPKDKLFFGFTEVVPGGGELGYFSLDDLTSVKGQFGLGIERDLYFEDCTVKELVDGKRP